MQILKSSFTPRYFFGKTRKCSHQVGSHSMDKEGWFVSLNGPVLSQVTGTMKLYTGNTVPVHEAHMAGKTSRNGKKPVR